jgi:hypothetical protein
MGIIRIVKDGIELSYVKETLSIRKENNSLIRDLKVSHTNFPFLLPENKNLKLALGPRDITSLNKTKTVTVQVYENDVLYSGELQILSYLKGYRKANLKFASPVLSIMNKKIADFMPTVSVTGATTGIPAFVEESENVFSGDSYWPSYVDGFINQGFPAVKWNFPMMLFPNKFGENLGIDDTWFNYAGKINFFNEEGVFELNTSIYEDLSYEISNTNVPTPLVYLLSPLYFALQSIGFTYSGEFPNDIFIKKILFLSFKDNLCKVIPTSEPEVITLPGLVSSLSSFVSIYEFTPDTVGTYVVKYEFEENLFLVSSDFLRVKSLTISFDGASDGYKHPYGASARIYEGTIEINVSASQLGKKIKIVYRTPINSLPDYSLTIQLRINKDFMQMHPTIQLGRYLPDWTFATYVNNLKNWFNLKFDIDDLTKKLQLNFNESWLKNQKPTILNKSMSFKSYEPKPIDSVLLKFENDEDTAIWIDASGAEIFTNQQSDYNEEYTCKFKYVANKFGTAYLSEELDSKSGVGLLIYDEDNAPFISESYNFKTLKIEGAGGIYESYWKLFIRFRLNASVIEMEGAFTKTEIGKFIKAERIYTNNRDCIVSLLEYKELNSDYYRVTFKVETFNL